MVIISMERWILKEEEEWTRLYPREKIVRYALDFFVIAHILQGNSKRKQRKCVNVCQRSNGSIFPVSSILFVLCHFIYSLTCKTLHVCATFSLELSRPRNAHNILEIALLFLLFCLRVFKNMREEWDVPSSVTRMAVITCPGTVQMHMGYMARMTDAVCSSTCRVECVEVYTISL